LQENNSKKAEIIT